MSLFRFNCKLCTDSRQIEPSVDLSIIISLFLIFNLFLSSTFSFLIFGLIWLPQLAQNTWNSSSKAPSFFYLVVVSIEHLYLPVPSRIHYRLALHHPC